MINELHEAKKQDIEIVTHVLTEAFQDYIGFTPVISDKARRKKMLHELFSISVKMAISTNNVYATSPKFEGVIIYYSEKYYNLSIIKLIKTGGLINFFHILRVVTLSEFKKLLDFLKAIDNSHKLYNKEGNQYLQYLAILPEHQNKKFASKLLRVALANFKIKKQGCYIETSDPKNVLIYEKYKYKLIEENEYHANGERLYCLYYDGAE